MYDSHTGDRKETNIRKIGIVVTIPRTVMADAEVTQPSGDFHLLIQRSKEGEVTADMRWGEGTWAPIELVAGVIREIEV